MKIKDDIRTPLVNLLHSYQKKVGCESDTSIRDLLTETMHFCKFKNIDFDEILESAKEVYEQEVGADKVCTRCSSFLTEHGYCSDETCPFSNHKQNCTAGWQGHPEKDNGGPDSCTCEYSF